MVRYHGNVKKNYGKIVVMSKEIVLKMMGVNLIY